MNPCPIRISLSHVLYHVQVEKDRLEHLRHPKNGMAAPALKQRIDFLAVTQRETFAYSSYYWSLSQS